MRLFEPSELESALKELDCRKEANIQTGSCEWWRTSTGELFSVPPPDELSGKYSDWLYYDLVDFAKVRQLEGSMH
jgi:hypothetical protein